MPHPRRGAATGDTVERDVVACDLLQMGPVFVTLGRQLIINLQECARPGGEVAWSGGVCAGALPSGSSSGSVVLSHL